MDKNMNVEEMNFENNEIVEEIVEACENADVSGGGKLAKVLLGLGLTAGAVVLLMKRKNIKEYLTARKIHKLEKMGYVVIPESDLKDCEEKESDDNANVEEAEDY